MAGTQFSAAGKLLPHGLHWHVRGWRSPLQAVHRLAHQQTKHGHESQGILSGCRAAAAGGVAHDHRWYCTPVKTARGAKAKPPREVRAKSVRAVPTLAAIRAELHELGDPVRGTHSQRFFKTGSGQYGEGDKFLGLTVPEMRGIVRKYRELGDAAVLKLLSSSWHEERLVALLLMVGAYDRGDDHRRAHIHRAYLANTATINNWDLVDASAGDIVGQHLEAGDITLLERLARSESLWERRIAIV